MRLLLVSFNKELLIGATWDIHLIRIFFWRRTFSVYGAAVFVLSLLAGIGLDIPGSNSGGDEIFRPGAHPASCTMGTGSFLGVKCGRGVLLTTHPLLVPRSWKSRAIPLPTLWATPGL